MFDVLTFFMDLQHYPLRASDDYLSYSFLSLGRRGAILKVITFDPIETEPHQVFNLSLADTDNMTKQIRDDVISDNGDKNKIVETVAESINIFCEHYFKAYILIRGNSSSRNRLYQMAIGKRVKKIRLRYEIYGLTKTGWQAFLQNQNYDGFLLRRND